MKMKRLMFVDEHKMVDYAGGVERVICNFANEFVKRNYAVSIVCMDPDLGMPHFSLDNRVDFLNLAYENGKDTFFTGNRWALKKIQKEILRTFCGKEMKFCGRLIEDPKKEYFFSAFAERLECEILRFKPDVILAISVDGARIVQMAIGKTKIPVIAMCHTDPTVFLPDFTEKQKNAWKKCNCIQVLLDGFQKELKESGFSNVLTIPNSVPQYSCENKKKTNKYIASVGRIDGSVKQQDILIRAFAKIAHNNPGWIVHIWGDVANKRYKQRLDECIKKYDLQERVLFEGTTDAIENVYDEADIFVSTSKYEGFGLALAEAMSKGTAVIGYRCCLASRELIGNDGLLFDDEQSLASSIQFLIDNPQKRYELGVAAHHAMERFAEPIIWDKWEECLRSLQSGERVSAF